MTTVTVPEKDFLFAILAYAELQDRATRSFYHAMESGNWEVFSSSILGSFRQYDEVALMRLAIKNTFGVALEP